VRDENASRELPRQPGQKFRLLLTFLAGLEEAGTRKC
jgi:hypothetical protein